jgi:uncharacterized protein YaaQ
MKRLILAIVCSDAVEQVSRALMEQKYSVTQISSVGGFLRRGSTTLVIGVDEGRVQDVLSIMREACTPFSKPEAHAATIFVLSAEQFIQT